MSSESAAVTPSSRLRLSVPAVSHTQIDAQEFADLLKEGGDNALSGKFGPLTVVDVRGADYPGGHVRGCVHLEFESLESQYDSLVDQALKAHTKKLVFVDLSKQQASVAAESFLHHFKAKHSDDGAEEPTVYVVTSGFTGILQDQVTISADRAKIELKAGAEKVIEDFDAAAWTAIAVPRTPSRQDLPSSNNMLVYKTQAESAQAFGNTPAA